MELNYESDESPQSGANGTPPAFMQDIEDFVEDDSDD